jgi:hypothetical protein
MDEHVQTCNAMSELLEIAYQATEKALDGIDTAIVHLDRGDAKVALEAALKIEDLLEQASNFVKTTIKLL